ncbi:hypothetical protein OSB04_029016, partial [Centaurea solstitialis]
MASSSSPSSSHVPTSTGGWAYDVFLSFRGEDTRYNFVDHLYNALVRSGLTTFKDDEMLKKGKEISPELLESIKESSCAVVVLSKDYANSSWCLVELTKIMECRNQKGRLVIPVFYHVEPSDVRHLKGDYETAFQQHKQKIPSGKAWALHSGEPEFEPWGTHSGGGFRGGAWHFNRDFEKEGRFVEVIAEIEWEMVEAGGCDGRWWWRPVGEGATMVASWSADGFAVGYQFDIVYVSTLFHEKNKEEMDKVNKWKEALKAVSSLSGHHIRGTWGESSFIDEIVQSIVDHTQLSVNMENDLIGIKYHINKLKSLLVLEATKEVRIMGISGMGGIGKTTIARALFGGIRYEFDGCSFINDVRENGSTKRDICALQVLLVLDDVGDKEQLEFLAAARTWFGLGSRIIITTRDEHVLDLYADDIYKPRTLPKEQALELFSRHAFQAKTPPEGYKELSARAIGYASGLPLALKVLGSHLCGAKACVWDSALNRLAKRQEKKIYEPLKISFDGLDDFDKEIFLDIACFFKGDDIESVTRKLDCCGLHPEMGINVLTKRSLITVSKGCIQMHDVLQEMGREIVRVSYPNSRLWKDEEICGLNGNQNLGEIKGIVHTWASSDNVNFSGDVFEKMNNIRLLETRGKFTSCEPTNFPDTLRWLSWKDYPFSSLPVASMHKLVGLEMDEGGIEHLWTEYQHLPHLKLIYLSWMKIKSLPDVSGAVNLERLTVIVCSDLVDDIHKSLGTLKKLAYLELRYCINLRYLPSMKEMPSLETINLTGCSGLKRFPEVSSSMVKLKNIYLNACSELEIIPNSICELKNLKVLHLQGCKSLQDLPKELGSMEKLEELMLGFEKYRPKQLDSINLHALTKLCCLRKLDLNGRQMEEQEFPLNFHEFSSLEELHLCGNQKLVQLPGSISRLCSLKHLELTECEQLQNIQGLPSTIQVLKARDCLSLKRIEDLSKKYASLHTICLPGCERLLKNKTYLDKMLQQSFIKKCIDVDGQLCIWIPGSKIPSWFEEQHRDGYKLGSKIPGEHGGDDRHKIALKLPPQRHT